MYPFDAQGRRTFVLSGGRRKLREAREGVMAIESDLGDWKGIAAGAKEQDPVCLGRKAQRMPVCESSLDIASSKLDTHAHVARTTAA
jgi:hypothetical protein